MPLVGYWFAALQGVCELGFPERAQVVDGQDVIVDGVLRVITNTTLVITFGDGVGG